MSGRCLVLGRYLRMAVTGDVLGQQIEYYRRRAAEYDRTAYGSDLAAAAKRIDRVVAALAPKGHALEIACGTGMWTQRLADSVLSLVALDAVAETIAIAEQRVVNGRVTFEIGNIFDWEPAAKVRFDTIFMAFWLSHVPRPEWARFLARISRWLTRGGRVLIVDECTLRSPTERMSITMANGTRTELRPLEGGAIYRIVKEDLTPGLLARELSGAGWIADIEPDRDDWLLATLSL